MQRCFASLLVVCSIGLTAAEAQVVRVGPRGGVRIRAPYASIDVLPYGGGTRVRTPFTAIDTGFYRYGVGTSYYDSRRPRGLYYAVPAYPVPPVLAFPAYPTPIYPAPVYPEFVYPDPVHLTPLPDVAYAPTAPREAARPIVGVLEDRLRAAALRLQYSLAGRANDGDVWQDYLAPQRIVDTIDQAVDPRPLRELLRNYNGVVANPSLASIRNAPGFLETKQLLQQFIERDSLPETKQPAEASTPRPASLSPATPPARATESQFPAEESVTPIEEVATPAAEVSRPPVPVPL